MRLKTTYFVCELNFGVGVAGRSCSSMELFTAIKRLYCELHGDVGWGRAAALFAVKHVDTATNLCIVRVATECNVTLHACLALLKAVGGSPVAICVRSATSTIRTLRAAFAAQHLRVSGRHSLELADSAAAPSFWETLDTEG